MLADGGHLEQINHCPVIADREKAGWEDSPTLVIVDAQPVECDARKVNGATMLPRRVLALGATMPLTRAGRLLAIKTTSASVQDRDGEVAGEALPWVKTGVVDGGCKSRFTEAVQGRCGGGPGHDRGRRRQAYADRTGNAAQPGVRHRRPVLACHLDRAGQPGFPRTHGCRIPSSGRRTIRRASCIKAGRP